MFQKSKREMNFGHLFLSILRNLKKVLKMQLWKTQCDHNALNFVFGVKKTVTINILGVFFGTFLVATLDYKFGSKKFHELHWIILLPVIVTKLLILVRILLLSIFLTTNRLHVWFQLCAFWYKEDIKCLKKCRKYVIQICRHFSATLALFAADYVKKI